MMPDLSPEVEAAIRAGTRDRRLDDVARLMHENRARLSHLPLAPSFTGEDAAEARAQALKDLERESLLLNGVAFHGNMETFLDVLRRLAAHLAHLAIARPSHAADSEHDLERAQAHGISISEALLRCCSRSTSGADSYFAVHRLLGIDDAIDADDSKRLVLMPRAVAARPIEIQLRLRAGVPSATIDCGLEYGLYAMDDDERHDSTSGSDSSQARKVRTPAARRSAAQARADEPSLARTGEADVARR